MIYNDKFLLIWWYFRNIFYRDLIIVITARQVMLDNLIKILFNWRKISRFLPGQAGPEYFQQVTLLVNEAEDQRQMQWQSVSLPRLRPTLYAVLNTEQPNELSIREKDEDFLQILCSRIAKYLLTTFVMAEASNQKTYWMWSLESWQWHMELLRGGIECFSHSLIEIYSD